MYQNLNSRKKQIILLTHLKDFKQDFCKPLESLVTETIVTILYHVEELTIPERQANY